MTQASFQFSGPTLTQADTKRLGDQLERVRAVMADSQWRTLPELSRLARGSEASVSARLRQLRSMGHQVDRRRVPEANGLFEYRVSNASQPGGQT